MEWFVRLIVGGGVAVLAGLWAVELWPPTTTGWVLGVAVAVLGLGALLFGIASELDVGS